MDLHLILRRPDDLDGELSAKEAVDGPCRRDVEMRWIMSGSSKPVTAAAGLRLEIGPFQKKCSEKEQYQGVIFTKPLTTFPIKYLGDAGHGRLRPDMAFLVKNELYQKAKITVPNGQITVPKDQKPRFQSHFSRIFSRFYI